jgi:hypothetical protein
MEAGEDMTLPIKDIDYLIHWFKYKLYLQRIPKSGLFYIEMFPFLYPEDCLRALNKIKEKTTNMYKYTAPFDPSFKAIHILLDDGKEMIMLEDYVEDWVKVLKHAKKYPVPDDDEMPNEFYIITI